MHMHARTRALHARYIWQTRQPYSITLAVTNARWHRTYTVFGRLVFVSYMARGVLTARLTRALSWLGDDGCEHDGADDGGHMRTYDAERSDSVGWQYMLMDSNFR